MFAFADGRKSCGALIGLIVLGFPVVSEAALVGCQVGEGAWLDGPGYAVEEWSDGSEDILILGSGGVLRVIDSSDPSDLVVLGSVDVNESVRYIDIAPNGDVVAVSDRDNQIHLVDISNRNSPQMRGGYNPEDGRQPHGMDIVGNRLYAAIAPAGVWVIDITNLDAPVKLGSYIELGTDFIFDLEVRGNYAYVADDVEGLRVVDISNPASPTIVGAYAASTGASNVRIEGSRAYVARRGAGIDILDLTNATAPSLIGTFNTDGVAYRAEPLDGNRLAIPDDFNGTVILDIATPGTPVLAGGHINNYSFALTSQGNQVFELPPGFQSSGLRSLNFTVSNAPVLEDSIDLPGDSKNVRVASNKVLVANGVRGMVVLDAAGFTAPVFADSYVPASGFGTDHVEWVNNVAVSGSFGQLDILNVADPYNIVFITTVNLGGNSVLDLDRDDNLLFAALGSSGLRIYNMANSAIPALLGTYLPTSDAVVRTAVLGNWAYTSNVATIRAVDVSNPALPDETDDFTFGSSVTDLEAAGSHVYVATQLDGVRIMEASPLGLLSEVAFISTGAATPNGVSVEGDRLYIALQELGGLVVYDVSNPQIPQFVEHRDTPGEALRVDINGGELALAEGQNGVRTMVCGESLPPEDFFEDGFENLPW